MEQQRLGRVGINVMSAQGWSGRVVQIGLEILEGAWALREL